MQIFNNSTLRPWFSRVYVLGENNREYIHHLPNLSKRSKSVVWSTFFWLELRPRLGPWASALLNLLHCCLRERERVGKLERHILPFNKQIFQQRQWQWQIWFTLLSASLIDIFSFLPDTYFNKAKFIHQWHLKVNSHIISWKNENL